MILAINKKPQTIDRFYARLYKEDEKDVKRRPELKGSEDSECQWLEREFSE